MTERGNLKYRKKSGGGGEKFWAPACFKKVYFMKMPCEPSYFLPEL